MKKETEKFEIITILFFILCTAGVLFKDMLPVNPLTTAFIHSGKDHYLGNIMLFLLLSPIVEEKFGKLNYLAAFAITTIPIYYFHVEILHVVPVGISAWICALMCMSIGKLKFTGIVLIGLYIFKEISGMFDNDSVSHVGHLMGFATGALYTFLFNKIRRAVYRG